MSSPSFKKRRKSALERINSSDSSQSLQHLVDEKSLTLDVNDIHMLIERNEYIPVAKRSLKVYISEPQNNNLKI